MKEREGGKKEREDKGDSRDRKRDFKSGRERVREREWRDGEKGKKGKRVKTERGHS